VGLVADGEASEQVLRFLVFPQLLSISPAIHDHVSPPDDARDNPQQETRLYILSLQYEASSLPR